ncbi:MAG: AMP-dependent synthetase/ligase [Armatimonadota bacterium]
MSTSQQAVVPGNTLCEIFWNVVRSIPDQPALGRIVDKTIQSITYREYGRQVKCLANGLSQLGIGSATPALIIAENRQEWAITDLAMLCLGAILVPVYTTLPVGQIVHLASDSQATTIFASNKELVAKAREVQNQVPSVKRVVVFEDYPDRPDDVLLWHDLQESGSKSAPSDEQFAQQIARVKSDQLATIIYTSGTTGLPKGVMLTHHNIVSDMKSIFQVIYPVPEDTFLSFLPLSHVFERTGGHYVPMAVGAHIIYCRSLFTVAEDLQIVKPTIMMAVPRFFESIKTHMFDKVRRLPLPQQKAFQWSLKIGRTTWQMKREGTLTKAQEMLYRTADKAALSKTREFTGGNLRFFISGGAAIDTETAYLFLSLGIPFIEGYGLTETSPVLTVGTSDIYRPGTIGKPIPGVEVRIADDGELLARGENIMKGYHNRPEATAEAIDAEGWLHTGDLGSIDDEGIIRIVGRKKEIIVLANGKNVAPQVVESDLRQSPYIKEIVLFGDEQVTLVAIITLDRAQMEEWAKRQRIQAESYEQLLQHPDVIKHIRKELEQRSGQLADFERVKKFKLLPNDFTVDGGELTPTLKTRRHEIRTKYAHEIESMYRH